ncbi:MAG: hypothetical protein J6C75_01965 [Oscillospiraceae bacterium]|nr:hypothetical protein [Oscillospiraceae bacterium]
MSVIRKQYFARLIGRILIFIACIWAAFYKTEWFSVLESGAFLSAFSPLHLLWGIWMFDMLLQIVPIKNHLPLGSQKLFSNRFRPVGADFSHDSLKKYISTATKAAYKVFALWLLLTLAIGAVYRAKLISKIGLLLVSVFFFVCDLICVLIWCPFRLMMHTRCCTTCRIFNWDHLMMFSPLAFMGGFFALSLFFAAVLAWLIWEICVLRYPERFWEGANLSLKCSQCTDKLCTQYCRKQH